MRLDLFVRIGGRTLSRAHPHGEVEKMRRTATHLGTRDLLATVSVATGALVYALWLAGVGSQGVTGLRVVTGIVLALGFAASASAVVPGFDGLLHGSKVYFAGTSLLGLGALAAGITALVSGREVMLGALVAANVALWAISTVRHTVVAGSGQRGAHARPTRREGPVLGS